LLVSCSGVYVGFDISIVSVEPAEHFIIFSIDDDLGEVMFVAIATFLVISIGFCYSPETEVDKCSLE